MIYTLYMLTPGVESAGDFIPKATTEDAVEVIEREGEDAAIAYALMGFDPEGDRWEVLMVRASYPNLVRRVRKMFGLAWLEWDGDAPMEFDRGSGIEITKYVTHAGESVISFGGLMSGMIAAKRDYEFARAEELARRLGVVIRDDRGK